jgi:hypothetical protein
MVTLYIDGIDISAKKELNHQWVSPLVALTRLKHMCSVELVLNQAKKSLCISSDLKQSHAIVSLSYIVEGGIFLVRACGGNLESESHAVRFAVFSEYWCRFNAISTNMCWCSALYELGHHNLWASFFLLVHPMSCFVGSFHVQNNI